MSSYSDRGFDLGLFIEENKAFILKLAQKYHKMYGLDIDDLFQEGSLGMMKAYEKYDTERGIKFLTYAYYWCDQKQREFCFKNLSSVSVPKTIQIADFKEESAEAKNIVSTYRNMVRIDDDENYIQPSYEQDFENPAVTEYQVISESLKLKVKKILDKDEYFILDLRLGLERPFSFSLRKVSEVLGCTWEWVRVREKRAIEKLREHFTVFKELMI